VIAAGDRNLAAALLFSAAAITDLIDGWLARRWGQTSAFGAFLDPVADKLIVCAALLVLLQLGRVDGLIALVIIGREITISALREWMATIGASRSVAVHSVGKLKTVAQMVAIALLLYDGSLLGFDVRTTATVLVHVAAALTLWSMAYYLRRAWPYLRDGANGA
jgi:CDP-diacylglycerol--glycerol-3-phosphate 3-phosphatidyltransferase